MGFFNSTLASDKPPMPPPAINTRKGSCAEIVSVNLVVSVTDGGGTVPEANKVVFDSREHAKRPFGATKADAACKVNKAMKNFITPIDPEVWQLRYEMDDRVLDKM
jgi:hypothetical protein